MTSPHDSSITAYVHEVLQYIPRTAFDRQKLEEDLRAHLVERIKAGNSVAAAIAAMGNPKEVATAYLGERPLFYAPLGQRVGAALIDYVIISIITSMMATVALLIVAVAFGLGAISEGSASCTMDFGLLQGSGWSFPCHWYWGFGALPAIALSVFGAMIYFPVAEGIFGQTVGKRLFGLLVTTESGLAIGAKEAIIRRVPYLFYAFIILDAVFVFFGQKRQRAFDRIAGTIVVRASDSARA